MAPPSKTVVGVDGSDTSIAAPRWAFDEAALTGASIEAMIAGSGRSASVRPSRFRPASTRLGTPAPCWTRSSAHWRRSSRR